MSGWYQLPDNNNNGIPDVHENLINAGTTNNEITNPQNPNNMNAEALKTDAKYVVKVAIGVLIALLIARRFD